MFGGNVFREAYADLYAVPRMTEARLMNLLERFGEPESILRASESELLEVDGVDQELASAVRSYQRSPELAQRIREARAAGAWTVAITEPEFPRSLKELRHSPPVLFGIGELSKDDWPAVAVVGTRRPSSYGRQVAEKLARQLAENGITVVSGLARGVDTCAHRGALDGKGRTLAVLGSGIDVCYPPENRKLVYEVASRGAVLTEFNLGVGPLAMNFPKRNRIVSGLSAGVVAVEAGEKSGVLNTVVWARDQGREVFAVPGRITDQTSQGINRLLRQGARPATAVSDILEVLGLSQRAELVTRVEISDEERCVLDSLSGDPVHVDDICESLGMPMSRLLSILMQLEVLGLVRQLPGKLFMRQA